LQVIDLGIFFLSDFVESLDRRQRDAFGINCSYVLFVFA